MRSVSADTLSVTVPLLRMVDMKSLFAFDPAARSIQVLG